MSVDIQFFGGFPVGDKLRVGTETNLATTDTTILNITSTAGVLQGININFDESGSGKMVVLDLKVTVDGAAERTLTGTAARFFYNGSVGSSQFTSFIPIAISFSSSLVIKLRKSSTLHDAWAQAYYSVF